MTTRTKSVTTKYLGKLLDQHNEGASESDIRIAFRDFLIQSDIALDESEIRTETRPAADSRNKVDLYIRNTYVEFKRNIITGGVIDPGHIEQLDNYILENAQAGNGIQNGILTDGKNYLKRSVGDHLLPIVVESGHTVFSSAKQGDRLHEYLSDIIDTQAQNITPSDENLTKYFGLTSGVFKTATALLTSAHRNNRDLPTVAVKRNLWKELLQVALGEESVDNSDKNDWLYLRHTYLTSLISVIVQAHFGIEVDHHAKNSPRELLDGVFLRRSTGIKGITESDLFNWPLEIGQTQYLRTIARQVSRFDWQKNPGELAATLYQNTILPEEREQMGEYYTPRWLAKAITEELITDPVRTRVLDPACGSGTFIASAIQHFIANSEGMPPRERLAALHENVTGIDLHPVAVQLAKATWVINSQPVILDAREADEGGEEIVAPIHLGDSLQLRYDKSKLIGQNYIELHTGELLDGENGEVVFQVPLRLAQEVERFDSLMLSIADAIENQHDAAHVLDTYNISAKEDRAPLETTIANMKMLHEAGRDHVWAYYLRNMSRPAVISAQRVDAIIGNPPWLTYSQSAGIIRSELENLSKDQYQIWAGGKNSPHQDIATLFFCRVMDLYLKSHGKIGMVLPHSALRSGQHLKWRSGYYEAKGLSRGNKRAISSDFSFNNPWDLSELEPKAFFPIPSCVVFASFTGGWGDVAAHAKFAKPLAPGKVEIWRGTTGSPHVARVISTLHHDDGSFHSPYAERARQGPTIVDRRLFFVTAYPNEDWMARPNTLKTYPAIGSRDKKNYSVDDLNGFVVSQDNVFDVYLGESMAPYVTLPPRTAVLPISKGSMTVPLDHGECKLDETGQHVGRMRCALNVQALDVNMRDRWKIMEVLWDENKGKNDRKTLFQNLNWLNKLTSQLDYLRSAGRHTTRIAYTQSGRPTAAIITDSSAILDKKLYQVHCDTLSEARYLLAIINSVTLANAVAPFRPKGLYGVRDLEKHLWKLPIPQYDPCNELHVEISSMGEAAEKSGAVRIDAYQNEIGDDALTMAKARSELRNNWQKFSPDCRAIEGLVEELLQSNG